MRSRQMILNDMPRKSSLLARPSVDELKLEVLLDIRELLLSASLAAEEKPKDMLSLGLGKDYRCIVCGKFPPVGMKLIVTEKGNICSACQIERKCEKCGKEFLPGSLSFEHMGKRYCFECKGYAEFEKANLEDDHQNG